MGVLQTVYRRHVRFNPALPAHRAAYWRLRQAGTQDPELRFVLEEGFTNVLAMMQAKIADHFSQPTAESIAVAKMSSRR
jgi:hypothetical protein